ncbi:MAG: creatininase family protein [Gemmataceae bacterium]
MPTNRPRPYILAEQRHGFIRETKWEVVILPFGATEPHNLHMPYATDNYQVDEIGARICESAHNAGTKVLLLPTIPYGVNTNYLKIPGALTCNFTPTTLLHIITDIVESIEPKGIRKILLLNGHGGNELKPLVRQIHHKTNVFLCVCDWYKIARDVYHEIFDEPGEHADEVETSLGLAFFPDLVDLPLADDGAQRPTRFEAINKGWISITRPWHLASTNTGMGNPKKATAEKGQKLMDVLVERISSFVVELANAEMDDQFPF